MLEESADPWTDALAALREIAAGDEQIAHELEAHLRPELTPAGKGSGYVVDTLHSARMVLERGAYEQVVKGAVSLGDDTDTTAAVAGGAAGVRDGVHAIPQRWRDALRGRDLVDPLLTRLLAQRLVPG